jgi:hypothetical protein
MSFALPPDLVQYLSKLDNFIATKIAPLQASNDNERFFDHRREHARTDWGIKVRTNIEPIHEHFTNKVQAAT